VELCLLHYIPRHDVRRRKVYLSTSTFKTLCPYVNCGLKAETTAFFTTQYIYMFRMTLRTNTQYLLKQKHGHISVYYEDAVSTVNYNLILKQVFDKFSSSEC